MDNEEQLDVASDVDLTKKDPLDEVFEEEVIDLSDEPSEDAPEDEGEFGEMVSYMTDLYEE